MCDLCRRICERDATVGIIGLGYVGLPLSMEFVEAGYTVAGFDISSNRVSKLRNGRSYIKDVADDTVRAAVGNGFEPAESPEILTECDVIVCAVPTGLDEGEPDMSQVEAAFEAASKHRPADRPTLFVVASTVYPGATNEIVKPVLEAGGRAVGDTALVAVTPERLSPGSGRNISDIPITVGGDTKHAQTAATTLYEGIVPSVHTVDSTTVAEASKVLENTYRLVNISLINELATVADEVGFDIWETVEAASTKPFGFQPFYPGPGAGGHCISVDPTFFSWVAETEDVRTPVLDSSLDTNNRMSMYVADRIERVLDVPVSDARIVSFGITYKSDVDDVRDSKALEVCTALASRGAELLAVDPVAQAGDYGFEVQDAVDGEMLRRADVVVYLVDHTAFDVDEIAESATFVFDAKGSVPQDRRAAVVRLGSKAVVSHDQIPATHQD